VKLFTLTLAALSRLALAGIFWVAVRVFHVVEIHGLEYATTRQPTCFAMAHKRDIDPLVELSPVLTRRGWSALLRNTRFAMRGDAFSIGFLARIVRHPRWLSRCLRPLSLSTILHHLGLLPLENLHLRPAEEWIRDCLHMKGDLRIGDVLTPAFVQKITGKDVSGLQKMQTRPLSHLLAWRYQEALQGFWGVDIFLEPVRRLLKQELLKRFKQELCHLSAWMAQGGTLWMAPEGLLSPTGAHLPITAALFRLLQISPSDTCIVPICIVYDFMTTWRSRIFVNLSPPILNASLLPVRELEAQLRRSWLLNTCFTCTQLASGFLMEVSRAEKPAFTLAELAGYIRQQATCLAKAGRQVDRRLLRSRSARKLAARFLKYARRQDVVRRIGRHTWMPIINSLVIQVPPGEVGYRQAPLVYAWNELQEMLSVSAPAFTTTIPQQQAQW
jgi:1-acyl-sn-glycerol-3-phosphate acyltransferase